MHLPSRSFFCFLQPAWSFACRFHRCLFALAGACCLSPRRLTAVKVTTKSYSHGWCANIRNEMVSCFYFVNICNHNAANYNLKKIAKCCNFSIFKGPIQVLYAIEYAEEHKYYFVVTQVPVVFNPDGGISPHYFYNSIPIINSFYCYNFALHILLHIFNFDLFS